MAAAPASPKSQTVGRYLLGEVIASGGMATVHIGELLGPEGFTRTVAIKMPHAAFASDPAFVSMFVDEARIAARVRHRNVVSVLDIVREGDHLFLVMDYIDGAALSRLRDRARSRGAVVPVEIASAIMTGVLQGLHAAHEAMDEHGNPLSIVHRDVSPQNILVGADGVPVVADFGIAKAAGRSQVTRDGQIKGKAKYMSPEQLSGQPVDRRTDVYSASVVLWELLTAEALFGGDSPATMCSKSWRRRSWPLGP